MIETLDAPALAEDDGIDVAAVRTYARSARAALDSAKDRPDVPADGLYDVQIAAWGGMWVQLRRLSFNQIAAARETSKSEAAVLRVALRQSFVQPPFSAGEVDELLDDPNQLEAAIELSLAVGKINKMTKAMQDLAAATFRNGAPV